VRLDAEHELQALLGGFHGLRRELGDVSGGHVDVGEVDQVQHASARGEHLARLGGTILGPAVARRAERAVVDVRLDALDRRSCGAQLCLRADDFDRAVANAASAAATSACAALTAASEPRTRARSSS
jgi:hypothetical protein